MEWGVQNKEAITTNKRYVWTRTKGRKLTPVGRKLLFKIDIKPMHAERYEYSIEDNCLLHCLKSVLKYFNKTIPKEVLTRIKIFIAENMSMQYELLHLYLSPINIHYSYETNVPYDKLRIALANKIPIILLYKDINHKIRDWKTEKDLFVANSNHAVMLVGIDERYLYMLDNVYKHGNEIFRMAISDFSRLWYTDYNDHTPATSYHFNIERQAIFFYSDKAISAMKRKDSIWNIKMEKKAGIGRRRRPAFSIQIKRTGDHLVERIKFAKEHDIVDKGIYHVAADLTHLWNIKNNPGVCGGINKEFIRDYLISQNKLAELTFLEENNYFIGR